MTRVILMSTLAAAAFVVPTLASAQTIYQENQRIVACERTDDDDRNGNRIYDAPGRSEYAPGQRKKQTRYYDEHTGIYYYK